MSAMEAFCGKVTSKNRRRRACSVLSSEGQSVTILVELRVQLVVRLTCYKGYVPSLRPLVGHQAEPQAANSQARPSCRYLTVPRFPCGSLVLMRFLFMSVSRDTYSGRRRSHLVVVHRLSLGLAERLAEEDKHEGKGVVRTTRQSM